MIRDGHEIFFSIRLNTDTHELIVYPINLYQKVFFVLANFFSFTHSHSNDHTDDVSDIFFLLFDSIDMN